MDNYHLTRKEGRWSLHREGAAAAVKTFCGTKREAIRASVDYLRTRVASLKIHKMDGRIQEERTYPRSADPRASKG